MGFFALFLALILQKIYPSIRIKSLPLWEGFREFFHKKADLLEGFTLGAGLVNVGLFGCLLLVVVLLFFAECAASDLGWPFLFFFHSTVLYFAVCFEPANELKRLQAALGNGRIEEAKQVLNEWVRSSGSDGTLLVAGASSERGVCAKAIGQILLLAHRRGFCPMLFYILSPGVMGVVCYGLAEWAARQGSRADFYQPNGWPRPVVPEEGLWRKVYCWVDWLPARLSAMGFAMVGDLEDAAYCWRNVQHSTNQQLILLSAASGALGLRILEESGKVPSFFGMDACEGGHVGLMEPDVSCLQSAFGLVWRLVVLLMGLFLLTTLSGWLN